jgi:hypothetical protein
MEHLLIGLLIIVILVMALFMIKSKKCLGGHRYAISSKGLNQEIWYKKDSYTNKRKPDSDSARNRHYIIRTCTKCGDEIAESYLEDDPKGTREVLAVSYAKSLISAIHKKTMGDSVGDKSNEEPDAAKPDPSLLPLIPDKKDAE